MCAYAEFKSDVYPKMMFNSKSFLHTVVVGLTVSYAHETSINTYWNHA